MPSGRSRRPWAGIPGRAGPAHLLAFPCVSANMGCCDGRSDEFRGGIILRDLPGAARVTAGSGRRVEVGLMALRVAESNLRAHIIPRLGELHLTEINTKVVQGFVSYLRVVDVHERQL
jgi:hypothetical protein